MHSTRRLAASCLLMFAPALVACGSAPPDLTPTRDRASVQPSGVHVDYWQSGRDYYGCSPNVDPECVGTGYDNNGGGGGGGGGGSDPYYECIKECLDNPCGTAPKGRLADCIEKNRTECSWECARVPH
jgi:hypothetical protein